MKIKDLKSPYRELAIKRTKEYLPSFYFTHFNVTPEDRTIYAGFILDKTPEGKEFWKDVYNGLEPDIPQSSETPEQDNNTLTEVLKEIEVLINDHLEINNLPPYGEHQIIEGKDTLLTAIGEFLKSNYELKSKL